MDNSFLGQVAAHYHTRGVGRHTLFVLPSRRAAAYLKKAFAALGDTVRAVTVSFWEERFRGRKPSERLRLITEMYECYRALNPVAESLDSFIFWGGTLLGDFDAVDRYLVDPRALFTCVGDYKDAQAPADEYLTDEQKAAIERFAGHFPGGESAPVKASFLHLWQILHPLYTAFRERLRSKGLSYGGMDARDLADRITGGTDVRTILAEAWPGVDRVAVIGLNALDACQKTVFRALKDARLAEFIWDDGGETASDPDNPSSRFTRENRVLFPPVMTPTVPDARPEVTLVSVPSSVGQAKLAPAILSGCGGAPEDTVFVLPDEGLLMPLLSAIPGDVPSVNVTMGYPVGRTAVTALVRALSSLQLTATQDSLGTRLHHKPVEDILSLPLVRSVLSPEEAAAADAVRVSRRPSVPAAELAQGPVLQALFAPQGLDLDAADPDQNAQLAAYLTGCLTLIGRAVVTLGGDPVESEAAARWCDAIEGLDTMRLAVLPVTWLAALENAMRHDSVAFEGEPLSGLQVMGTLETRALDFRNIVILGANEDLFPKRDTIASFIPPELRRAFGLPAPDHNDALWSYHFHRLIRRAEKVWIVYDSRTDGMHSGEPTRYARQLEYLYGWTVRKAVAKAGTATPAEGPAIPKTEEDIEALRAGHLSASAMQAYLECPAKFYYGSVRRLVPDEGVKESLDAAMLGTAFHEAMQTLYSRKRTVTTDDLDAMIANEKGIRAVVSAVVRKQARAAGVSGRNVIIADVIVQYVLATLRHDRQLLEESGSHGFRIIGLERKVTTTIEGFPFIGFIDRIDAYKEGEVRIVDYKTGHVENDDILITDRNAEGVCAKLFGESNSGRPKIALQLFLYGLFAHEGIAREDETVVNSIYSTARLLTDPLPDVPESEAFREKVRERLRETLREVADTSVPWKRTCDPAVCQRCDFRTICGR